MTVRELIKELEGYNPDAKLTVGDNVDNGISIGWGGDAESSMKEACKYVCFDVANPSTDI